MKSFQSWSPRTRPLNYDALQQDTGCQDTNGTPFFSAKPFIQICIAEHNFAPGVFTRPDTVSYATGPVLFDGLPPFVTRWAAWVAPTGVRITRVPQIDPSSLIGNVSPYYGNQKPTKVSIAFTDHGKLTVAIQKSAATIEVKSAAGTFSFLGTSGVLFQTALLQQSDNGFENDLVIYYLRREIKSTIFVRFARENFAIEHVLNTDLQADIARIIAIEEIGGSIVLYGIDAIGRDLTLSTDVYALVVNDDRIGWSTDIIAGDYRAAAVAEMIPIEALSIGISVEAGSYRSPIKAPAAALSGDESTLTVSIYSGEYSS